MTDHHRELIERLTRERDAERVLSESYLLDRNQTLEAFANELDISKSLKAERDALRLIVSQCAEALGNGAAIEPDCTIEFMQSLPSEIGLHVASLVEDMDQWKEHAKAAEAERDALRAEVVIYKTRAENAEHYAKDRSRAWTNECERANAFERKLAMAREAIKSSESKLSCLASRYPNEIAKELRTTLAALEADAKDGEKEHRP
jgi:hypothetical protein